VVVVAVTGGIGSGKSAVAAELARRGAVVVDADQIARQVVEPTGPAYQRVVDHFGPDVVHPDGSLDRGAIAARVFSDPGELTALNAMTHPAIAAEMMARIGEQASTEQVVVLDIPLLDADAKQRYGLGGVIVVEAPVEVAIRRLVEQRRLGEADARARVAAQIGLAERRRLADFVIDNGGTRESMAAAVDQAWEWIQGLTGRG
jgi:dephospho-CoA kinase